MRVAPFDCNGDFQKGHFWFWDGCDGIFCKYVCMDCGEIAETLCVLKEEEDDGY